MGRGMGGGRGHASRGGGREEIDGRALLLELLNGGLEVVSSCSGPQVASAGTVVGALTLSQPLFTK